MSEPNQGLTLAEKDRDGYGTSAGEASTVQAVVSSEDATDPHQEGVRAIVVDSPEWVELIRERRAAAAEQEWNDLLVKQQETARSAVGEASARYVVAAPVAQQGEVSGVGGLVFVDGVAVTDDLAIVSYCRGAGYAVKDLQAPEQDAEGGDAEDSGVESRRVTRTR